MSLTIDNSDGALPIEYAEVTITRIMFRNGGSEYQINGDTCRLLDIQELLSDSGIGREMHVIVGQGQLDSVLHADPMGRRAFIEEAAGVLKHRKRKEKALRKLDAMQANLARVQDLTDELRRQLKPLGRQAAVARRAAVIQADLRDARLRLLADDLVRLRQALQSEIADEAALKERKESAEAELKKALQREALLEDEVRQPPPGSSAPSRPGTSSRSSPAGARHDLAGRRAGEKRPARRPPRSGASTYEDMEREAARIREQEAELEAALEAAEHALEDTVAHRAELERELAVEERRLKDVARAIADRREGLARLNGQVNAARSRAACRPGRDRPARRRPGRGPGAGVRRAGGVRAAEGRGRRPGRGRRGTDGAPRGGQAGAVPEAEAALSAAREAATAAERRRAATQARHEALALGLRRKDGTGALLGSRDRLTGLLGPAAELLSVTPGHEVALAAAFGAADAIAVTAPASAAEAIRLLRKQDAGRAALLLAGAPEDAGAREAKGDDGTGQHGAAGDSASGAVPIGGHPDGRDASGGAGVASLDDVTPRAASGALPPNAASGDVAPRTAPTGPPYADLVRGPAELMPAVRRLLRGIVVVGTLEDAEDLVYARPEVTAVTAEGDLLGAHFAHRGVRRGAQPPRGAGVRRRGGCRARGARRAVRGTRRGAAPGRRGAGERAALVEELGERRRAAEREKSSSAPADPGRLAGQARGAAGEAERSTAAAARAQEALDRAMEEAEELAERLAVAEEMPVEEEPDTAVRDRLAADGANARQTEMEARLQVRTHEERVKGLAGRADGLDRAARAEREARARAEQRRARLRHEAAVAEAVASRSAATPGARRGVAAPGRGGAPPPTRPRPAVSGILSPRATKAAISRRSSTNSRIRFTAARYSARRSGCGRAAGDEGAGGARCRTGGACRGLRSRPARAALAPRRGRGTARGPGAPAQPAPASTCRAGATSQVGRAGLRAAGEGKSNPLALEEFAALEERHKFLSEQLEDLKKTRADLLQVVKEVDERVEQVFTEAYRDTAREFEGVFSRLFPGGDGRLILTDPDNMLTTGVDVESTAPRQEGEAAVPAVRWGEVSDRRRAPCVDLQGAASTRSMSWTRWRRRSTTPTCSG